MEAVSGDGRVTVGNMDDNAGGAHAAYWPQVDEPRWICETRFVQSQAVGVDFAGSVITGYSRPDFVSSPRGFIWSRLGGFLEPGMRFCSAASGNGKLVAGTAESPPHAAIWSEDSGLALIGVFAGSPRGAESHAYAISRDGSTVVGAVYSSPNISNPPVEAFRWTASLGIEGLGHLAGGDYSVATAVSRDGTTIVGSSDAAGTQNDSRAFRWTEAEGMVSLGTLADAEWISAQSVSGDGSIIIGHYDTLNGNRAFLWTEPAGIRPLAEAVLTDFGLDLAGWTLERAKGISDDGLVIVGEGRDPNQRYVVWRITLDDRSMIEQCPADLTGSSDPLDPSYGIPDGDVDGDDFFVFLDAFVVRARGGCDLTGSSDPSDPLFGVPDCNCDSHDFFYYLDHFVAGCN